MTDTSQHAKHLILLGAGHAHLHLLSTLAKRPLPGIKITLISPYPRPLYPDMVPGLVAGHHTLGDCAIALEPLLKNTGVRWLGRHACGLDADSRTLTLDDGSTLSYDWLSINTGPIQDRQRIDQVMPGAREHGLFVRPMEAFGALWPRVTELAQTRALRLAVIGGGAVGIELATAIQFRLPTSSVTLITGDANVVANDAPVMQMRVIKTLKRRNITVLAERVVGIEPEQVMLASGARLACDVPVIATDGQAPTWLGNSGLALDEHDFVAVDAHQRSTSHPNVFVAGDLRTGAGAALAKNLAAVVAGLAPSAQPPASTLNWLSCGDHFAMVSWGKFSAQGRWVWWLKNWMDRSLMKRYRGV